MKRAGGLWSQIVTFDNLYLAYTKARLGKRTRQSVANFSYHLEEALIDLQRELVNGRYPPGGYRQFIIRERKPRLISAAPFRDRVVHHALMNVLEPELDKRFYYHSYACRKDKGVHRAVDQYQQWANQYAYVMKLDIARYFPSIQHDVLKQQLRRVLKEPELLELLDLIVDSSPVGEYSGCGLPIGNLTSQYFANLYLNEIDHWLKQTQRVPAYLRYVDDFILLDNHKDSLHKTHVQLIHKLQPLGLSLHSRKQTLMRTDERVDVLGYKVSRHRRWLRNDNGYRFQRRLKKLARSYAHGHTDQDDIKPRIHSWIGHALHGETGGLRQVIFEQCIFQKVFRPRTNLRAF